MAFIPHSALPLRKPLLKSATARPSFTRYRTPNMSLRADLDHVALDCVDQKRMHTFYTTVLNFKAEQTKAPFPSARLSDITIIDFLQTDGSPGLSGGNHMCFTIQKEDFEPLKTRLEGAGIHVGDPVLRSGARGNGWSVYVKDPEENMLEFRYYDN